MSIPPSNNLISTRVVTEYSVSKGTYLPQTTSTQATSSLPVINPPLLLCADSISFRLSAAGKATVIFPAIPYRSNSVNPLDITQPGQQPLNTPTQDVLLMDVSLFNAPTYVEVSPFAITVQNTRIPGPFLGGGQYLSFGVDLTGAANTTGMVFGKLYIARG